MAIAILSGDRTKKLIVWQDKATEKFIIVPEEGKPAHFEIGVLKGSIVRSGGEVIVDISDVGDAPLNQYRTKDMQSKKEDPHNRVRMMPCTLRFVVRKEEDELEGTLEPQDAPEDLMGWSEQARNFFGRPA